MHGGLVVGLVAAWLVEDLLRDVVETHLPTHGCETRDHDFAEVAFHMVSVSRSATATCSPYQCLQTYSLAYPIPPIVQTAVSHAANALSAAMYLHAFAYSPVANPSSHIFAACMTINLELSS